MTLFFLVPLALASFHWIVGYQLESYIMLFGGVFWTVATYVIARLELNAWYDDVVDRANHALSARHD